MATRAVFSPLGAEFPAANFAPLTVVNRRPVLAFDAATSESAYWTTVVPQGFTGAVTLLIQYCMASATTGGVAFDVAVEAITPTDALDLDATTSFDTVNAATDAAVPGTAGYMEVVSVTLTNLDSAAVADYLRISVARDVADGADTATGDLYLVSAELRDEA